MLRAKAEERRIRQENERIKQEEQRARLEAEKRIRDVIFIIHLIYLF